LSYYVEHLEIVLVFEEMPLVRVEDLDLAVLILNIILKLHGLDNVPENFSEVSESLPLVLNKRPRESPRLREPLRFNDRLSDYGPFLLCKLSTPQVQCFKYLAEVVAVVVGTIYPRIEVLCLEPTVNKLGILRGETYCTTLE